MNKDQDSKSADDQYRFAASLRLFVDRLVLQRRRLMIVSGATLVLGLAYLFFVAEPYYDTTTTILPEYGNVGPAFGGLSDLASIAGISVGDYVPTDIYPSIILSETVLHSIAYDKYLTAEYRDSINLVDYFDVESYDRFPVEVRERRRFLELYDLLSKDLVSISVDKLTKILTMRVRMPESRLSAEVSSRIVANLDFYVREKRKSFAKNQSFYVQKRLNEVRDSLASSEDRLKDFNLRNQMIAQSPGLVLEQQRLLRSVSVNQTVFIELTRQLEIAKIDEVKDSPIINLKESADEPVEKTGPKRLRLLLLWLVLSHILLMPLVAFSPEVDAFLSVLRKRTN